MSKVIVHRHAVKYLNRLPKETKDQIKEILKQLENNPYIDHIGPRGDVYKYHIDLRFCMMQTSMEEIIGDTCPAIA